MSHASKMIQCHRTILRRTAWLLLGAVLIPSIGCTPFATMCSNDWHNAKWLDSGSDQPVSHMLTYWDKRIRIVRDTVNQGREVPGLAGRLLLFNEDSKQAVDANGTVVIQMHDMTNPTEGKRPEVLVQWTFDAKSLKLLKSKNSLSDGYTLFLPWETYSKNIRQVQLHVCYTPKDGTPRYADPVNVTLEVDDESQTKLTQQHVVPALQQRTTTTTPLQPQRQEQIVPVSSQQPPQIPAANNNRLNDVYTPAPMGGVPNN
jgi:hypothetical protein